MPKTPQIIKQFMEIVENNLANNPGINMKVYLLEQTRGDDHILLYAPEIGWIGWLEYFDGYDMYNPFIQKNQKDLMLYYVYLDNTYSSVNQNNEEDKLKFAKENMKFTLLGEL